MVTGSGEGHWELRYSTGERTEGVCLGSGGEANPLTCDSTDTKLNPKMPFVKTPSWDTVQVCDREWSQLLLPGTSEHLQWYRHSC